MLRNSSTYIYLAVAVGLFCYLTFIDKKIPGTKEREDADSRLFNLDPDGVIGLEITNLKGQFIFQKIDNHWEIGSPVNTPADGAVVDGIINQIAFAQPQRIIPVDGSSDKDTANLKEWGLIPPAERVVIHTKDKHYVLLVGRKMAINDSVYARASEKTSEPVRIIPDTVKEALQKDLSEFRSRNIFDFNTDNVTQVATRIAETATTPGQQCEVDLKDGKWTLALPLVARASDGDMQALLGRILGEHVVDFVTDDAGNLSPYGLTSPAATLSVTLKTDEPMVLEIGGPVPNKPDQVYAQRLKSNSVFTLARSGVDDLLKAVPDVRDRHILPFDPNKPTGLSWSLGAKKGEVRANHALWNTIDDDEGPADVGKVNDLLVKLSQLETTPVLKDSATDLKPFGLDKPQGKITIQSPEFKPEPAVTLLIGKAENKLLYVRNSAEPFIYTVPDNALDFLPANNLAVRDARAINLNRELVRGMTITAGSKPPVILSRSPGGTWSTVNVKDRMVDSLKADTQASLFCQLQAKTWLGPAQPSYGLAKPVLTIAIQADRPSPAVLRIGAAMPDGGHAAQVEGDPTAFEISDGDYSILNSSTLQLIPQALLNTNAPSAGLPSAGAPKTNSAPAPK
ncbi:MAG TPA: DUF4340 domain-containing protein [Candidatus Methylacidiphilales bacterium]|jgi:hypothetical protein|nr:DUF4340 domain-containing protein [Candidatus Methylacidiphilales bacterium]